MSMKKWLIAAGIVGLLAIAYFWGGDGPKSVKPPVTSTAASQAVGGGDGAQASGQPQASSPEQAAGAPTAAAGELPAAQQQEGQQAQSATPQPASVSGADKAAPAAVTAAAAQPGQPSAAAEHPSAQPAAASAVSATPAPEQPAASPAASQLAGTVKPPEGGGKDKYQTDPVPSGKPQPVEWQDVKVEKDKKLTATLSVVCTTILDHMDKFNKDKREVLPADGVIYQSRKVTFYEGESVFDVLLREMKNSKIHMEFSMTPMYNSNYIEGINNIYEFDCGELSGWMYKVNGWYPNYGSSRYKLKDGDVIEWVYTCDLGRDIGAEQSGGNRS